MELESAVTGVLRSISIPPGGEAAAGQVIANFAVGGDQQLKPRRRASGPGGNQGSRNYGRKWGGLHRRPRG